MILIVWHTPYTSNSVCQTVLRCISLTPLLALFTCSVSGAFRFNKICIGPQLNKKATADDNVNYTRQFISILHGKRESPMKRFLKLDFQVFVVRLV